MLAEQQASELSPPLPREPIGQSRLEQPLVSFPFSTDLSFRGGEELLPGSELAVGAAANLFTSFYPSTSTGPGRPSWSDSGHQSLPDVHLSTTGLDPFGKESFLYNPETFLQPINMAQNFRPPARPPPPISRPPPPMIRIFMTGTPMRMTASGLAARGMALRRR